MDNLKAFDPDDVDETLTRVVSHGGHRYLLFPYIDANGATPEFKSIGCLIAGAAASVEDFAALSALLRQAGAAARWRISFNTPWLVPLSEAADVQQRAARDQRR